MRVEVALSARGMPHGARSVGTAARWTIQPAPLRPAVCRHRFIKQPGLAIKAQVQEPANQLSAEASATTPGIKFQPFLTNAQNDVRRRILEYSYQQQVPGGTLLIKPVSAGWLHPTADLLAESFADTLGSVRVYKSFLRNSIVKYLQQHISLPPKAVVLMALLLPSEAQTMEALDSSTTTSTTTTSGGSGASNVDVPCSNSGSSEGRGASSSAATPSSISSGMVQAAAGLAGEGGGAEPGRSNRAMHTEQQQEQQHRQSLAQGQQAAARAVDDSLPGSLVEAEAADQPGALSGASGAASASVSSSSFDGRSTSRRFGLPEEAAAGQEDAEAAALKAAGARLVGVVELSFTESTRTKHLTLNPPPTSPYLCNMAVQADVRGRGIGMHILAAAEELTLALGSRDIHLHLRFQDAGSAPGRLYEKAGYTRVKSDNFLIMLLGMNRRHLLRKQL